MKSLSIIFLVLIFNFRVLANEAAMLYATNVANQLAISKTYKDWVAKVNLTDKDRKQFSAELARLELLDKPLPSFSYENMVITFKDKDKDKEAAKNIVFDFSEIAKNYLSFQGNKINLKNKITYFEALKIVRTTLSKKNKNVLFRVLLPNAYALPKRNPEHVSLWASLISSSSKGAADLNYKSTLFALEDTINQSMDASNRAGNSFPLFTCESGNLVSISNPLSQGDKTQEEEKLTFNYQKGFKGVYYFIEKNKEKTICHFEADFKGIITSVKEDANLCAKVGDSIYEIRKSEEGVQTLLFGDYPKIADACCKKNGCYKKIRDHVMKRSIYELEYDDSSESQTQKATEEATEKSPNDAK